MIKILITLGMLNLLAAISPGPDFAVVTKNTLAYSRRHGIMTALGISVALLIHVSYASFGLSYILQRSVYVFRILQWVGGAYLMFLGARCCLSSVDTTARVRTAKHKKQVSVWLSFWQGFLTNALNPKCALFFLSSFAYVVHQRLTLDEFYLLAAELFLVVFIWFTSLSLMLSHPTVRAKLLRYQPVVMKILGVFLFGFGLSLIFLFHPHQFYHH